MKKKPAELRRNPPPRLRNALVIAAYLFAFIIFDFMTKQFQGLPGIVAWYPPAGLTYTLLLVFGVGFTPAVTIALFISSVFIYRMPQPPSLLFLWAFIISLIYSLAAAFLRRQIRFDWQLRKLRDVAWLVFTAVVVSALLAILSVSSSALSSAMPRSEVLYAIFEWWIGETVGVLTITPFLLIFVMPVLKRFAEGQPVRPLVRWSFPHPTPSAIGQTASVALIIYLVFGAPFLSEFHPLFLIILPILWIALDHGLQGVSAGLVALNFGVVLALWFFRFDPAQMGELELLMIVTCIAGLLMGAVVTERKGAEEALLLKNIVFDFSIAANSIADSNGIITEANKAFLNLWGYPSKEEVIGKPILHFIQNENEAIATITSLNAYGKWEGEYTAKRKDSSTFIAYGLATDLKDSTGKLMGYQSAVLDVTQRKQLEDGLIAAEKLAQELLAASSQSRQALLSMVEDQKRTEERLAASEAELRSLFAAMTDLVIVLDAEGRYLKIAPTKLTSLYRPPDEMLGKTVHDILPQEQADYIVARLREAIQGGETVNGEYALQMDGQERWFSASASRLSENTAVWVAHDITQRVQAEEAVQSARKFLRSVQDALPFHIAILNETGVIVQVNTAWRNFGAQNNLPDPNSCIGQNYLEICERASGPDVEESLEVAQAIRDLLAGRRDNANIEYPCHAPHEQRWFVAHITHFDDNHSWVVVAHENITERKLVDESLEKRSNELLLINEVGREIAGVLNLQNVLEVAARRIQEAFGFYHVALFIIEPEKNELVMKARAGNFAHIFPGEHRVKSGQGVVGWTGQSGQKILANDVQAEPKYFNPFPELLPTQAELSLPLNVGNQVVGVLDVQSPHLNAFSQEDVTVLETLADQVAVAIENARLYADVQAELAERKKAEVELLQHREHLEELIKVRTAELMIAKENADAANRAKSDFLATMSHEIRTPLNGVLGMTHLVLQTNLNDKQRDYLFNIQYSGESLLATINDILDFSKIEAGKIALEQVDFNLDGIFQGISGMMAHKAQEKGLELVFNTAPDVPRLLVGDPLRLGQVLANLLGNAVKFTEAGDVIVKTSLVEKTKQNVLLEFTVHDTGIGLTQAQMTGLFQPFSQADTSISRKYGGTGLGLTISQRLVKMMGGEIKVDSQTGQGATFTFRISLKQQAKRKTEDFAVTPELSGLRVLVVDDHTATQEFLQSVLESFTFHVTLAGSAQAGLAHLEQKRPRQCFDLVLMDHSLSGEMDGLEAIRQIKQNPKLSAIPALLLIHADEMHHLTVENAPDGYLVKPITRSQLFDEIMRVFGHKKPAQIPAGKNLATGSLKSLHGRRALLVEDNAINQLVATEMLQSLGLQVSIANNGEEAVKMVKDGQFEVVLMDIQMPGMDGYQATARIRTDPRFTFARLPMIAITAHALADDRGKALEAGLNDYLTKPIDMSQLANTLLSWLAPQETRPQREDLVDNFPTESESASSAILPAALDSINMQSALTRLGDKQELYLRLLLMFRENQAETAQAIRSALQSEDLELARRLAHTFKGTAATIGADQLSLAAKNLETAIAQGESALYAGNLAQVEQELAIVMAALASVAITAPAIDPIPGRGSNTSHSDLGLQLNQLAHMLIANDAQATVLIGSLLQQPHETSLQAELKAVERLIRSYDFENALKELDILAQKQNILLPKPWM